MVRFNNDYNRGAHPEIIRALSETNSQSFESYGTDDVCKKAANEIKKYLNCPKAQVFFLCGGTQANVTVISSSLRPCQSVISAQSGHINVHETGAVEFSGHKIEAVESDDGKITAAQIEEKYDSYINSGCCEHLTRPKMVYISFPTEVGTVYTKKELLDISAACKKCGMYLFVDGARMAYGLAVKEAETSLALMAEVADVFTCGGTKCGALFGEAVVITNSELAQDFRSNIKQKGGMLAKGWLLGLQFDVLFKNGLYFEIGRYAVELAMKLRRAFEEKKIELVGDCPSNQQFAIMKNSDLKKLSEKYTFEIEKRTDPEKSLVRFCTAWSTKQSEIDVLISDIAAL